MFNCTTIKAALAAHGTVFFDRDLKPVTPVEGQWFCEFDLGHTFRDGEHEVPHGEAIVEYVGEGRVVPDGYDCDRRTHGDILILQS